jgi:hypothetical protein
MLSIFTTSSITESTTNNHGGINKTYYTPDFSRLIFIGLLASALASWLLLEGVVSPFIIRGEHGHGLTKQVFGSGAFIAGFDIDRLTHHTVFYSDLNAGLVCTKGTDVEKLWGKPLGLCQNNGQYQLSSDMIAIQTLSVISAVVAALTTIACGVLLYYAQQSDNSKDSQQLIFAFAITSCSLAFIAAASAIAQFSVWAAGPLPAALVDGKSFVPIWGTFKKKLHLNPPGTKWTLNTNAFGGIVGASILLILTFVIMLIIGVKTQEAFFRKRTATKKIITTSENNQMELLQKELLKGDGLNHKNVPEIAV